MTLLREGLGCEFLAVEQGEPSKVLMFIATSTWVGQRCVGACDIKSLDMRSEGETFPSVAKREKGKTENRGELTRPNLRRLSHNPIHLRLTHSLSLVF